MKKSLFMAAFALVVLGSAGMASQPTYGIETESQSESIKTYEMRQETNQRIENEREKLKKARDMAQTKKDRVLNNKQQVCKNREASIKQLLTRVSTRATNHIAVFNKITQRTQDFYVTRGKTLGTYNELVAAVTAKKLDAENAVKNLSDIAQVFTCDVDNPQASIQAVRDALRVKRDTMQAYKTAVKNLIVGVKSVQGASSSTDVKKEDQ